jgi:hypothetical protein
VAEQPVTLTLSGRPVGTVFDLLGHEENHLTFALGWGLAQVPSLTRVLLANLFGDDVGAPSAVTLQQAASDRGYTDIEVLAGDAHVVIEAKRGWVTPSDAQLARYAPRLSAPRRLLVALTECSPAFAARRLPEEVSGVPVVHLSWNQVAALVDAQSRRVSGAQRRILRELHDYLRGIMTAQDIASNWTYVVALNRQHPLGSTLSFLDVVVEKNKYFHPYASGEVGRRYRRTILPFVGTRAFDAFITLRATRWSTTLTACSRRSLTIEPTDRTSCIRSAPQSASILR